MAITPILPRDANGYAIPALYRGIISVSGVAVSAAAVQLNATPSDGVTALSVFVPTAAADGVYLCDSGGNIVREIVPGEFFVVDAVATAQETIYAKRVVGDVTVQVAELG